VTVQAVTRHSPLMSIAILMNIEFSFSDVLLLFLLCGRQGRGPPYSTTPTLLLWFIGSSQRQLEGKVTKLPLAMSHYGLWMWWIAGCAEEPRVEYVEAEEISDSEAPIDED